MARAIAGEMIKALAVLALVFLSFAHQPVQLSASGDGSSLLAAIDLSFCGSEPGDDHAGHSPCHACRGGIADLAAPPCVAERAYAAFAAFDTELADDIVVGQAIYSNKSPRAPPALA